MGKSAFEFKAYRLATLAYLKSQALPADYRETAEHPGYVLRMANRFTRDVRPSLVHIEMFEGDDPLPIRVLEHYQSLVDFTRGGVWDRRNSTTSSVLLS